MSKENKITKDIIEKYLKDTLCEIKPGKRSFVIHAVAYEDEDGNIICPFLDEFDKEMKKSLK